MKSGKTARFMLLSFCAVLAGVIVVTIGCEPRSPYNHPVPDDPRPVKIKLNEDPSPDIIELEIKVKGEKKKTDLGKPVSNEINKGKAKVEKPKPLKRYLLRRGDEIEISVHSFPEMTRRMPIRPDGWISYSHVNEIKASGRTIADLQKELQKKISEFINDPRVTVIGISFVPDKVSVLGTVNSPGIYEIERGSTVLEVLAKCGGVRQTFGEGNTSTGGGARPNLSAAYILRTEEKKFETVNLDALLNARNFNQNKVLNHRDVLYVPNSEDNKVFVLGEVGKPQVMYYSKDISFIEAFTRAGGPSHLGRTRKVYLVRGSLSNPQVYRLNAMGILRGKKRNFLLKPGDIVYVSPTALTRWQRLLEQIVPSMSAALTADATAQIK